MADQVHHETSKLTNQKLHDLKNMLKERQTIVIKPNRPDRIDLNSEIIIEKKAQILNRMKKVKVTSANKSAVPVKVVEKPVPAFGGNFMQKQQDLPVNIPNMTAIQQPISIPVQPKYVMPQPSQQVSS